MMMLMVMRRVDAFVRSSTPWMLLKFLQRFLVGTVLYQSRAEAGDGPEAYQGLRMSEEGLVREMISDVPPDQNPFEFQKPSIVGLGLPNVPNYADDLLIFFMLIESLIILGSTFLVIFPLINGPEMRKRHLWIWHKSYLGTTGKTLTTFFFKQKRLMFEKIMKKSNWNSEWSFALEGTTPFYIPNSGLTVAVCQFWTSSLFLTSFILHHFSFNSVEFARRAYTPIW